MIAHDARLGDFLRVKHGYAFDGQFFDNSGDLVLLTPGSFYEAGGFRERGEKTKYYVGDIPEGYVLDEGDIVVAMTEQAPGLLGSSAWIPAGGTYLHNQRLGRVVDLDESRLDRRFLYYLFNTESVRHQISATATGGKVRHTAPERIGRVVFACPPLGAQRRVAGVITAYDDLIENNRRRMALLEGVARQLYSEWFGRLRFPGREHTGVVVGLPKGWAHVRIGDVADCVGGGTPSTSVSQYWEDGDVTWVTPTDVTRNDHFVLLDSAKKITEVGLSNSSAKLVPPHAVLMTSRASVGFFAFTGREVCTNQGLISVVPHEPGLWPYLLFHLSDRVEEIRAMGSGSTYPEVSRGKFRELVIVLPNRLLTAMFCEQATDLLKQIRLLKQQNERLRAARDLLLPHLMSGALIV